MTTDIELSIEAIRIILAGCSTSHPRTLISEGTEPRVKSSKASFTTDFFVPGLFEPLLGVSSARREICLVCRTGREFG